MFQCWFNYFCTFVYDLCQTKGYRVTFFPHSTQLCDKWVPVTTAWRVLRLRMEERPPDVEGSCEYTE